MTDTPAPTPSPQLTPAPSPPLVAPSPEPVAVARPEWLPEAHWDPAANTIKPEFGQHYSEVATFHKNETEKAAALAARKPEDIKFEVKLPDTIKVPDGMKVDINPDDPRVPVIREMAIKRGWDQDTVNELVALDAQQQIAAHNAEIARVAAADAKLGPKFAERKTAVGDWLKGMKDRGELDAHEYEAVRVYATDAETVTALEKIIAKANGRVPGGGGNEPPKPAEVPLAQRWYQPQKAS